MGLAVTVLGCSGSYPGPGGACSGYLVDDGSTRVWLDAGSGTLANLQLHSALDGIDAVVLSHEHPDHWADIEGYQNVLRFVICRQGMPVYAPAGVRAKTYQGTDPWMAWHQVADGDQVAVGSMSMTFSRTDHGPETLAVRIDGGDRSLGYSADTGPGWSLSALGPGLDLALCEATLSGDEDSHLQHLSAGQAGKSGREAGVGRLVLTHLWPTLDFDRSRREGSEAFGAEVELAAVHARYEL